MSRRIGDTEREMLRDMYAAGQRGNSSNWEDAARLELRVEPEEWPESVQRAAKAAWTLGWCGNDFPEHDHYYSNEAADWLCRECATSTDFCESGNINKLYA